MISPAGSRPIRSIAVMPFANLAHDSSQDYFVEGMHDALITELAKLGAFAVTSRATVFAYKGSSKPAKQIAQELGVDALIEGSALRSGKKVRITAQLIRGTTDEHLWAESYDRDLEDVLGLLNDVSRAIANEVQTTLARGNRTPLPEDHAAHRRVLPEAYDLHLRAHSLTMGLTSPATADFLKILELHRRSVELDPNFAEGWTGVAFTNLMLGFFRRAPAAEVIPRAREAALKALTLDEGQGGAQGVLGTIDLYFDWNFESAKSRLERAVALNPHSFGTRHAWADYLMVMGRFEESLAQVKLARSYEPASPLAHAVLLFHGMATRRYDEFIAEARRSIAQFPKFGMLHGLLAEGLWRQGRYAESIAEEKESFGADSDIPLVMQSELERAGPNAAIKAAADRLAAQARAGRGSPLTVAACYADAGERDSAFQWLEKVYAERVPQILHIVADPSFDGVRNDPRYTDLMRRIGIPARPLPGT
jgi:TolB-like protein